MYTNMDAIASPAAAQESSVLAFLPRSRTFTWLVTLCAAALVSAPLIIAWTAGILLNLN
jgi:hypothetical protein